MEKLSTLKKNCMFKIYFKYCDFKSAIKDEEGLGTMELVLIMIVLIAIVLLFKDKVSSMLANLIQKIETKAGGMF